MRTQVTVDVLLPLSGHILTIMLLLIVSSIRVGMKKPQGVKERSPLKELKQQMMPSPPTSEPGTSRLR